MRKHLFLLIVFTLFIGCFLCEAQPDAQPLKKASFHKCKFWEVRAVRITGQVLTPASFFMLDKTTAALCLNDSSMVLYAYFDLYGNGGTWYYNDSLITTNGFGFTTDGEFMTV